MFDFKRFVRENEMRDCIKMIFLKRREKWIFMVEIFIKYLGKKI